MSAPSLIVDCTVRELEPAVFDERGVCVKPPVLAMPQQYRVELGSDTGTLLDPGTGQPVLDNQGNEVQVMLDAAGLPVPETVDEWSARQQQAAADAEAAAVAAEARAAVELRMIRDRWLAQTDYIEVFLTSGFTPLPQPIQDAVTANRDGWLGWRQALRDLPSLVGAAGTPAVTALGLVGAVGGIHKTTDVFPAPWPQPPSAPVIHLT